MPQGFLSALIMSDMTVKYKRPLKGLMPPLDLEIIPFWQVVNVNKPLDGTCGGVCDFVATAGFDGYGKKIVIYL